MNESTAKQLQKYGDEVGAKLKKAERAYNDGTVAGFMHTILPVQERKFAKIDHMEVTEKDVALDNLRSTFNGRSDMVCRPGTYTRLLTRPMAENGTFMDKGWVLMMSDTPYEIKAARFLKWEANGHVLIAGLGLGATTLPVLQNPAVKSVTVIELNRDVIAIVEPALKRAFPEAGQKLIVHCDDALTWKPAKGQLFDTMWFDIWPSISADNLPEMTKMKRHYAKRLNRKNPKCWVGVWEEHYLRRERRL
jgi:hypothetical protein